MKPRNLSLLQAALVTPAFGAGHVAASIPPSLATPSQDGNFAAQSRLKIELLSIDAKAKLDIAGDRIQLLRLADDQPNTMMGSGSGAKPTVTVTCQHGAVQAISVACQKTDAAHPSLARPQATMQTCAASTASSQNCTGQAKPEMRQGPPPTATSSAQCRVNSEKMTATATTVCGRGSPPQ